MRPAIPAAGLIANDTYNHFQGSTGEVLASGTVTESVQAGVWQETARMASQNYFSTDGKLIVHQRYEDETGTGQRWGVWEEYRYDALGRRVLSRTQRPNTICNVANCYSSITRFIWDGDQLALELRAPGTPTDNLESTSGSMPRFGTVAYTHGGGIDRPLGLLRGSTVASTFLVVPHTDWRGLFDRETNSSGQLFDNRPGEPPIDWPGRDRLSYHDESRNTQPLGSRYGSLIQDMKDESGLAYRRNRYYDPNTGRFVQQDPIGLAGGINLYGFAGGDPVNFSDPFGLCAIKGAAASVAMGRGIAAATGSEYGAGSLALDLVGGALCAGVVVRGVQLLRGGRQAARAATATRAAGAGDEAFHHTFRSRLASIQTDGLRPGSYATPRGGLSPLQAHIDLALPGGLRDAVVRIDLAGLRAAGFEIPEVTRVGRSFGMPGGGFEMRFPYAVPSEFIRVVTP